MTQHKNLSKGTSKKKLIESTHSNKQSSGSITLDKRIQSTTASNIVTTYIEAADDKSMSL